VDNFKIKLVKDLVRGDLVYLNHGSKDKYGLGLEECIVLEVYPSSNCMGHNRYGISQSFKVYSRDNWSGFDDVRHLVAFENMPVITKG
jgi:hypothetical protein